VLGTPTLGVPALTRTGSTGGPNDAIHSQFLDDTAGPKK
jgi:hypothetical protein